MNFSRIILLACIAGFGVGAQSAAAQTSTLYLTDNGSTIQTLQGGVVTNSWVSSGGGAIAVRDTVRTYSQGFPAAAVGTE